MAQFKGVLPAGAPLPNKFGLFSVASVTRSGDAAYEDRTEDVYSYEYDSVNDVSILNGAGAVVHTIYTSDRAVFPGFGTVDPFWVEVEDNRNTTFGGLVKEDRFALVLQQLERVTQKAVERELAEGNFARAAGNDNNYLARPGTLRIAGDFPYNTENAPEAPYSWGLLEQAAAESSAFGELGIIHAPQEAINRAMQYNMLRVVTGPDGREHLETINGYPVAAGTGYRGYGPLVAVTAIEVTSNVGTLTYTSPAFLSNTDTFVLSGTDYDGEYAITDVDPNSNTITFAITESDFSSESIDGTIQILAGGPTLGDSTNFVYITGPVFVHLGKTELGSDTYGQGYDVSGNRNELVVKAFRPVSYYFDPAIHFAVRN